MESQTVEIMIWALVVWNVVLTLTLAVVLWRWNRWIRGLSVRVSAVDREVSVITAHIERVNGRLCSEEGEGAA